MKFFYCILCARFTITTPYWQTCDCGRSSARLAKNPAQVRLRGPARVLNLDVESFGRALRSELPEYLPVAVWLWPRTSGRIEKG